MIESHVVTSIVTRQGYPHALKQTEHIFSAGGTAMLTQSRTERLGRSDEVYLSAWNSRQTIKFRVVRRDYAKKICEQRFLYLPLTDAQQLSEMHS